MGLSCSIDLRQRFGFSEKIKETNQCITSLCNEDGEETAFTAIPPPPPSSSPPPPPPPFPPAEIEEHQKTFSSESQQIVLKTWDIIKRDIERVGVVMFMGLLEDPEIRGQFMSFRNKTMEELKASAVLRSHVLRVMGAVEKAVARLDNEEKLLTLLHDLGQRHLVYNVRPEFLDLIGPEFNIAIKPALGDKWTPEVEKAWGELFKYITNIMKEKMVM